MKRMSDVFELPIKHSNLPYLIDRTTYEEDALIIHAINHVDKLADALEVAIDTMIGNGLDCYDGFGKLVDALAAYRGEA
jgi:hypothetical protein